MEALGKLRASWSQKPAVWGMRHKETNVKMTSKTTHWASLSSQGLGNSGGSNGRSCGKAAREKPQAGGVH